MITRIKAWFKRLVVAEIAKINAELQLGEKLAADFKFHSATLEKNVTNSFAEAKAGLIQDLNNAKASVLADVDSHIKAEFSALEERVAQEVKDALAEIKLKTSQVEQLLKDDPEHWKADAEAVATDLALRKVK